MAALIVVSNNERQLYTNENHKIVNGNLVITAKKEGEIHVNTYYD
jgi:hypothetical protein